MPTDMRMRQSADPERCSRSSRDMPAWEVDGRAGEQRSTPPRLGAIDRDRRRLHEPLRGDRAALQLEAQHAAEAVEQLARPRVARVALEPGVVHPLDRAMCFAGTARSAARSRSDAALAARAS